LKDLKRARTILPKPFNLKFIAGAAVRHADAEKPGCVTQTGEEGAANEADRTCRGFILLEARHSIFQGLKLHVWKKRFS